MPRPSPSDSATLYKVGHTEIGNDLNVWKVILTSNNVKRWSMLKATPKTNTIRCSVRRSTKRTPVKRTPVKITVRRLSKRTVKKRSTRKSRSAKRRSTRKSRSTKRTVRRSIKRSTKRTLVKKRSTRKSRSAKRRSTKRTVRRSTKRTVKRSTKRVRRSTRKSRSVKRTVRRLTRKSRSTKKTPVKRRSVRRSTKRTIKSDVKQFNRSHFNVMLANKYAGQNPTDYFISEKLDGLRSVYDSETDTFWSRTNKQFFAPKFFTKLFPKEYQGKPLIIDGELFMGRSNFDKTGIFRKKIPISEEWEEAMYYVFDLPMINAPFEERYSIIKELLSDIPYIHVVEQTRITSDTQMNDIHKNIVEAGGEGSMLRLHGSYYENKRSKTLLKLKDFQDAEVKVIGHELGEGRNENVLGALHVKWKDSKMGSREFKVGSGFDDYQRANYKSLFPIGTIITIKYFEQGPSGRPRFPTFWRVYKE